MLRLDLIANPAGASALTLIGVGLVVLVAAGILALWIFVAGGRARHDDHDFDESSGGRGLEALRHLRLVRRPRPPGGGPQAASVVALEPAQESEPTAP